MNKLIPFTKFSDKAKRLHFLSGMSIVVNEKWVPLGFVFDTNAFIAFLEHVDEQFEAKVDSPNKAFENPAGRLIDLIEEKLPLNPKFVNDLKISLNKTKKTGWISFDEVVKSLNV